MSDTGVVSTFDDWQVVRNVKGQLIANQTISVVNDQALQNLVSLSFVRHDGRAHLELKTPFGVDLRSGVVTRVDQHDEVNSAFLTALPDGCVALQAIDDAALERLQNGHSIMVGFRNLSDNKTIAVKGSLKGLPAAIRAL